MGTSEKGRQEKKRKRKKDEGHKGSSQFPNESGLMCSVLFIALMCDYEKGAKQLMII